MAKQPVHGNLRGRPSLSLVDASFERPHGLRLLDGRSASRPGQVNGRVLGACPACGRDVKADGHAIRLHNAFFHVGCALYRRDRVA